MSYVKRVEDLVGDLVEVSSSTAASEVYLEVHDGYDVAISVLPVATAVRLAHHLRRAAQSVDLEAAQVEQMRLIIEEG